MPVTSPCRRLVPLLAQETPAQSGRSAPLCLRRLSFHSRLLQRRASSHSEMPTWRGGRSRCRTAASPAARTRRCQSCGSKPVRHGGAWPCAAAAAAPPWVDFHAALAGCTSRHGLLAAAAAVAAAPHTHTRRCSTRRCLQATCTASQTTATPRCCSRALRLSPSCCAATCRGRTSGSGGGRGGGAAWAGGARLGGAECWAAASNLAWELHSAFGNLGISLPPAHPSCGRRGSYYQRAWQAVVTRAQGLQHIVQPNTFAMQLPHGQAYAREEAALAAFEAVSGGKGGAALALGMSLGATDGGAAHAQRASLVCPLPALPPSASVRWSCLPGLSPASLLRRWSRCSSSCCRSWVQAATCPSSRSRSAARRPQIRPPRLPLAWCELLAKTQP